MASAADLPCDGDGICMICKQAPPEGEAIICSTCTTPWHVPCLSKLPETLVSVASWECPDCSAPGVAGNVVPVKHSQNGSSGDLVASIRAIEADVSLTEQEKAKRRQELVGGGATADGRDEEEKKKKKGGKAHVLDLMDEKFKCSFCIQLPERPVTTPCGHNFCLKCFQKWVGQGKHTCVKCRSSIPQRMAVQPRINSALVVAIRMARAAKSVSSGGSTHVYHFIHNENRPDKAFTTERAKKAGKANACSGQIFVTIPSDHFGPIFSENDPRRNQGILVGETWEDRMECRQWGAHFPHVAGIAGQSDYGAQSVALSGGYEDDEDHGEWFLYTGSGGRDLSGNKRTNKEQAFDQKFEKLNEALRVSCQKGYPVRVVRSFKEKRSCYAPEKGVRYDGIYRIEKCWRKVGIQGFKVCRYLFVRCDNDPAPWTSDELGDRPRPLPVIKELKHATDITERKECPAWDYDEKHGWKWIKSPPLSRKPVLTGDSEDRRWIRKATKHSHNNYVRDILLKEFSCLICRNVMTQPLTTPCAHNFCKLCLLGAFPDLSSVRARTCEGCRTLRPQKIERKCPCCPTDISEFLQNPQVNRELSDLIESLQHQAGEDDVEKLTKEASDIVENSSKEGTGHDNGNLTDGLKDFPKNKIAIQDLSGGMEVINSSVDETEGAKYNVQDSDSLKEKKLKAMVADNAVDTLNSDMGVCEKVESKALPTPKRRNSVGIKSAGKKLKCNQGGNALGGESNGAVDKKAGAVNGDHSFYPLGAENSMDEVCGKVRKTPVKSIPSSIRCKKTSVVTSTSPKTRSQKLKAAHDNDQPDDDFE